MRITIEPETEEEAKTASKVVYERLWAVGIAGSRGGDTPLREPPVYHSHGPPREVYERLAGLMFCLTQLREQSPDGS